LFLKLLELLFPSRCRICGKNNVDVICRECLHEFPRLTGETCNCCGSPLKPTKTTQANQPTTACAIQECAKCHGKDIRFASAKSAGIYKGSLKTAIHQLKYKNGKALAPYLAHFMHESEHTCIESTNAITYVPITKRKEAYRGYNQSQLVAKELSKLTGLPCSNLLLRLHDNEEQNKSKLSARSSNVAGAFAANNRANTRSITGKKILLIDDVLTTGSTVNECSRMLIEAGFKEIHVFTIARTPFHDG
jgi:ComF family protein